MKKLILITLICISSCDNPSDKMENTTPANPEKIVDPLGKYAYWITCSYRRSDITSLVTKSGSGFFVRRNNRLFFITAMHTLAELKASQTKNINTPYSITIHFSDKNTNEVMEYIAPLYLPPGYKYPGFWDQPDVSVFPIENYNLPVFSVDELQAEQSTDFNNLRVYGFPETLIFNHELNAYKNTQPASFNFNVDKTQTLNSVEYAPNKVCIFNYVLFSEQLSSINSYGYSGGPVFAQNNQTKTWNIAGLLSWSEKYSGDKYAAVVVQIKHILAFIDQLVADNNLK